MELIYAVDSGPLLDADNASNALDALSEGDSTLHAVLVAYLRGKGFHRTVNGWWGHPQLGEGRTFTQVVAWQIGREMAGTA